MKKCPICNSELILAEDVFEQVIGPSSENHLYDCPCQHYTSINDETNTYVLEEKFDLINFTFWIVYTEWALLYYKFDNSITVTQIKAFELSDSNVSMFKNIFIKQDLNTLKKVLMLL